MNTHPNAFRMEAAEARKEGERLIALAKNLEAKADDLLGIKPKSQKAPAKPATPAEPPAIATAPPEDVSPEVAPSPEEVAQTAGQVA